MARPDSADGARCGRVLSTIGFLLAFLWASPVNGAAVNGVEMIGGQMVTSVLLLSQKIFYFHMPVAITSFIALAFAGYYAVRFLMTKNRRFDTCSKIAMEVALLFVACTMITGDLWTRFEWGVWWTWDPRLTTYLILMLIIIGLLHPAQRHRRARAARHLRCRARHHRAHRRAHLLHDHAPHSVVHPPGGTARGRHEPPRWVCAWACARSA